MVLRECGFVGWVMGGLVYTQNLEKIRERREEVGLFEKKKKKKKSGLEKRDRNVQIT